MNANKISNSSSLHNFFAQVTAHVPDAIKEHIGDNDIGAYINQFIVVIDLNLRYREHLDDITRLTEQLSDATTKPNVFMSFVRLQLLEKFEPIWVFECKCSLSDNLKIIANLFFSATELLECELDYYADADDKNLIVDPESIGWLHEAQLILLKMPT